MKFPKPLTGSYMANWFRKKKSYALSEAFDGHIHEVYDHEPLTTTADKLALLEAIDKKWRGKRCSVATLVFRQP